MAVKIRLSRLGTKNAPVYRVVAIDTRCKRDGEALEILGTYNPISGNLVQMHDEKIQAWVKQGALMSDAVKRLHKLYLKKSNPGQPTSGR